MIRLLAILLLFALPSTAQQALAQEPLLLQEMDKTEAVPGQAISLRLTVLVPTYLPKPPVWPSFDAPNLLVSVVSTASISQSISGLTWAGVSRRYLIAPMLPGSVILPAQEIGLTWADPDTNTPRVTALLTDAVTITGVKPEGAEGLDPFIAADNLTLEQVVEGAPESMVPGDSLTRTVTATIEGSSPMFLPPLLSPHTIDGVRAYPDEPSLEQASKRGVTRGSRTERVTLVAEGVGIGKLPEVKLDWYNLGTGRVETAKLPTITVSVDGPPAVKVKPEELSWGTISLLVIAGVTFLALLMLATRYIATPLRTWIHQRRADWMASETWAWRRLHHVVAARDHAALGLSLETWAPRVPGHNPRKDRRLSGPLTAIGATRYGNAKCGNTSGWRELDRVLTQLRREGRQTTRPAPLKPLNPNI